MKLKNKIISLTVCLSFCLVALFNVIYFKNENINTHQTIMNSSDIDYMSLLDDFDEKELVVEEDKVKLDATQYLDEDFFSELDNLSYNDEVVSDSYIDYSFDIDGTSSLIIVTINSYVNNELVSTETMKGVPFTNEEGKLDAIFNDEGEVVYLSELSNIDEFQNCGLFSKLKKAVKKVTKAVTETVKVAAVAVIGGAVLAGVAVGVTALAYATGGASLPATLPVAMSTLGWVTAGLMTIVGSVGIGTAIVDTTIDVIGSNTYDSSENKENFNSNRRVVRVDTLIEALTISQIISSDNLYYISYIDTASGQLVIERNTPLNYVEAISVLVASGIINGASIIFRKSVNLIGFASMDNSLKQFVTTLRRKNISQRYVGIYTQNELDASKLAYAMGAFQNGIVQKEIENVTPGSGYYWHFHDAAHLIHVFYGTRV